LICNECKTIIGFEDNGSDQDHMSCDAYDCRKVYCRKCVENEDVMFFCYKCEIHLCRWCIVSVRDPDDEDIELGTACTRCCEIDVVGPVEE
jgi:hypothetical protein